MNGEVTNWNDITRYSGYVQQDDLFYGSLTVREHLIFMVNWFCLLFDGS